MYLARHGIKGQKWGERRYQYKDGSLTPEGRKRYGVVGSTKAYISQRRKNTRDRWKKEDSLDTWHDSKVSPVYKKEKSKQISRKEANREYDRYWKEYEGKLRDVEKETKAANKQASKQYRADLKRGFSDKKDRLDKAVSSSIAKEKDRLADKGEYGAFGHIMRSGIRQVQGEVAARAVGKALIKKALKSNPNLSVNSDELLRQAGRTGRVIGTWYARGETAAASYAKKKRDEVKKATGNRAYRYSNKSNI